MKGFFSILFLSNAVFFLWLTLWAPEQKVTAPYQGISMVKDGLLLLDELEEERRPAVHDVVAVGKTTEPAIAEKKEALAEPQSAITSLPASSVAAGCYESPPLDTLQTAEQMQQILSRYGVRQSMRKTVNVRRINYWVQLPAYKSLARAEEVAAQLKRNRIKDFFVVKTGQHQNAISLGVYSSEERAEERIAEIVALKTRIRTPVIEGLEMTVKQLVVQISVAEEPLSDALTGILLRPGEQWKKIPCK